MRLAGLVCFTALVAGSAAGGATALFVTRAATARGHVVHLGPLLGYVDGAWCDDFDHFCIPEPEPGEELTAFYTFTTAESRARGCPVTWRPTNSLANILGPEANGGFRGNCDGSVFDRHGHAVFGPAPRDLDRFRVITRGGTDGFDVDTRTLICGASRSNVAASCARAPRPD